MAVDRTCDFAQAVAAAQQQRAYVQPPSLLVHPCVSRTGITRACAESRATVGGMVSQVVVGWTTQLVHPRLHAHQ